MRWSKVLRKILVSEEAEHVLYIVLWQPSLSVLVPWIIKHWCYIATPLNGMTIPGWWRLGHIYMCVNVFIPVWNWTASSGFLLSFPRPEYFPRESSCPWRPLCEKQKQWFSFNFMKAEQWIRTKGVDNSRRKGRAGRGFVVPEVVPSYYV